MTSLLEYYPPPSTVQITEHWRIVKDGDRGALEMYERHYSAYNYMDGRKRLLFMGPGFKIVLIESSGKALFCWRKFIDDSGQTGVNCAVFRNESNVLSSVLILEAERVAWCRWPGERLYTFVNKAKVKSENPGCCFKKAGWKNCGTTKNGLLILEKEDAS